jgi:hypothetical protein
MEHKSKTDFSKMSEEEINNFILDSLRKLNCKDTKLEVLKLLLSKNTKVTKNLDSS